MTGKTFATNDRTSSAFRSDVTVLLLAAAAALALHVVTNGQYGFHRDELQTLDDARHLDWGFVVYPPITPLIGRIELVLFGTSLIGFRSFAAVAVSTVMVLAGLIARELGGKRHAQLLAAVAAGIAPVSLVQGAVFQYVSFDYLWGTATTYFLVRLLKSEDSRWWVAIGIALGLGMETRYTAGFLALGIAGSVLLTSARRFLRNRWLWIGAGVSVLVFLPNLIWQSRHSFISLQFLSHLHARDLRQGRYHDFFPGQLLISVNPATVSLLALGLWFIFRHRDGRRYRLLGWSCVLTFLLFAVAGARSYYTAPLYPSLIAAGCGMLERLLEPLSVSRKRTIYGMQWSAMALGGVAFALIALPVAPINSALWRVTAKTYDQFREEIGWPELARTVADVYRSLPPSERARAGILAGNYGEAGALNLYGPALGLPRTMALTNSFWYRGYDPRLPETVIVDGFDLDEARELFDTCAIAAKNTNPYGVKNEESTQHPDILLCRHLKMSWPDFWARSRRFG